MSEHETEKAVFGVYLDVERGRPSASEIVNALAAAGFEVHSVHRLDTTGFDYAGPERGDGDE